MAIRVRKLARELERSAGEVLGLLHHLGYEHYKSDDDMVPDPVVIKLRSAIQRGVRAEPVAIAERAKAPPAPRSTDLMSQLVPGVVRQGESPRVAAPRRSVAPTEQDAAAPRTRALEAEVDAARAESAAARADLAMLREVNADLARQLKAAQEAMAAPAPSLGRLTVAALLQERGLRGSDEAHRALVELASARRATAVLSGELAQADAAELRRVLQELALVSGTRPAGLEGPMVTVSADRADAPGDEEFRRRLDRLSELLLLNGLRRVAIVGLPPRWHAVLTERVDRRIDLLFVPNAAALRGLDARGPADVVWSLGVQRQALGSEMGGASTRWVVTSSRVGEALDALLVALRSS